ncbi:MAG: hypothetical protein HC828_09315 [Blastochloris sp.]|nr:hypothetical protein [Blastochloris sp.]
MWNVTLIHRLAALSLICACALGGVGVWLAVYPAMPRLLVDDTIQFEGIACRISECTFVVPRLNGADDWSCRGAEALAYAGLDRIWTSSRRIGYGP